MANYNIIERYVAKYLEKIPWLRELIKFIYKRLIYLGYRKSGFIYNLDDEYTLKTPYSLIGKSDDKEDALFFGYYDKSPWNEPMNKAIFHSYSKDNPTEISLKCFDLEQNEAKIVAKTSTWNWQQGAMAQWLNEHEIIFNTEIKSSHLGSQIYNVDSKESKNIDFPIQCVSPDGKHAISLNYKRLMILRPDYGYVQKFSNFHEQMPYDKDGLWLVDIEKNKSELIISIDSLMKNEPTKEMLVTDHKVNHVMYSPDGESIIFLHRWLGKIGKWSRLYLYTFKTGNLEILLDNKMVSHYSWRNKTEVITWARHKEQDGYYSINIETKAVAPIADEIFNSFGDGHPTCNPVDEQEMISDSYPDKGRVHHLFKANSGSKEIIYVGDFYAPWKFDGVYRCDLHPRWSPDGKLISIDSSHSGLRKTYLIKPIN